MPKNVLFLSENLRPTKLILSTEVKIFMGPFVSIFGKIISLHQQWNVVGNFSLKKNPDSSNNDRCVKNDLPD